MIETIKGMKTEEKREKEGKSAEDIEAKVSKGNKLS